jgi:probable HAF family extracellular repeat protein
VNSAGTVVGTTEEGTVAFVWNVGAVLTPLEMLVMCFGCNHGAAAINESGIVIGSATFPSGEVHAVRWVGGEVQDIGALPGDCCSYALGINQSGDICGSSDTKAVIWTGKTILDLQAPTDASNVAHAINSGNQTVGEIYSHGPFFSTRPFLWSNGVVQDLGTFGDEHVSGSARSINNDGWIVGSSFLHLPPSPIHACLWKSGQIIDLNDHVIGMPGGGYLENAADINNANQIVGSGWIANAHIALFLDPIPPADINADGVVNVADLLAVINAWGTCPSGVLCAPDVNEDEIVNVADLLAVINSWG